MSSQVFYRKWRPQAFGDIVGQEHVTRTLLNALANEKVSHAYLFCGPRGTGKTSTARSLAKAVNCLTNGKGEPCNECDMCQAITEGRALDIIEVDAASNRGIDEIRDLREKVNYVPNQARYKVYIIDEVHMLTKEASNALLKTLEEPPPHVIFVLATTEAHKLLPTILSRCQRFDFHRIPQVDVIAKLTEICQSEGITVEPEGMKLIARAATGSLRDAENLLQQLTTFYGSEISLRQVQTLLGISDNERARELVKSIVEADVPAGITAINNVNNDGLDLRQFHREVVEYLRQLLIVKTGSGESLELTGDDLKELTSLAEKTTLARILTAVKQFGQLELSLDNYSTLPLELALVDSTLTKEAKSPEPSADVAPEPLPKKSPTLSDRTTEKPASPAPKEPVAAKDENPASTAREETEIPEAPPRVEQKPEPAATTSAAATNPLGPGSAIEQLQLHWKRMINEAPNGMSKTPAAALLRSARPMALEENTIIVAFKFPYHKDKMDNLDNQKTADKIVSSFLGRSCRVQCVYEHENNHLVKAVLDMGAQVVDEEEA